MANEAVLVQRLQDRPMDITVAVSGTFSKGAVLGIIDPNTGSNVNTLWSKFAGITAEEKVVDRQDRVGVWTYGVFDMTMSGTCSAGNLLGISTTKNMVSLIPAALVASGGNIVGKALQDGADGEVIEVLVGGR